METREQAAARRERILKWRVAPVLGALIFIYWASGRWWPELRWLLDEALVLLALIAFAVLSVASWFGLP